jgi:DNA-directed RNA polymerase subunit RPC12/RpoP
MNKPILRCRCGHQVLEKEVLRAEPYEKESGREAVYVKYRCRRCKSMGEAFFDRLEWKPEIFEVPRNEMSDVERDRFLDEKTISSGDVISFHRALSKTVTLEDLKRLEANPRGRRVDNKVDNSAKARKNNEKGNGETPSQARRPGS